MAKIRFLHLSDFHVGMGDQKRLYPFYRDKIFDDIHKATRGEPVDVVLFTGDLTQRGSREEFELFDAEMERLLSALPGSKRPALLAVPGNHDLVRPDPYLDTTLAMRSLWEQADDYRGRFWDRGNNSAWALVQQSFEPYTTWWQRNVARLPESIALQPGALPGDFSATINIGGYLVGVVGLNSAWRQLTGDDYEGKLDVDLRQLNFAIASDPGDWFKARQLTLLMTHHPPTWLSPRSKKDFDAHVAPPGRFTANLFGHQHIPQSLSVARMGLVPVEWIQAPSLFGLERIATGDERVIGYSVLEFSDESGAHQRRLWPRRATRVDGTWTLNPDASFALDKDNAVTAGFKPHFEVTPAKVTASPVATAGATPVFRPPGGPFVPELYLSRPKIEREALLLLQSPGRPAVLHGTKGCGRTWLLQAIQHEWRKAHPSGRTARLSFRSLGSTALKQLDHLVYAVAEQLSEQLDASLESPLLEAMHPANPLRGTAMARLKRFLVREVVPRHELVLVALDDVDVIATEWREDFYGGLRSWMEEEVDAPIHKLRFLLSVSTNPTRLIGDNTRSLFNLTQPIEVPPLREEEIEDLARRAGMSLPRETIAAMTRSTHGVPQRVAEALFEMTKPR